MADMNPFERLAANRNRGRTYARSATSSATESDQPYKSDQPRHTVQVATILRSHDPRFSVDPSQISVAQSRRKSSSQSPPRRRNPLAILASASTRDLSTEARVGESRRHALPIPSSSSNVHALPPPSPSSPRSRSAQSTSSQPRSSIAPRRLRRAATDSNSEIGSSVAGSSAVSHHGIPVLRRAATDSNSETPEKIDKPAPPLAAASKMLSAAEARDSKNEPGRSEPISPPTHSWAPGAKAMAQGLVQDKHLNGKICTVQKVDDRGYVHVFFDDAELQKSDNKGKWKLSGKNLMPVMAMFDDDSDEDNDNLGSDDESDDEEVIQIMAAIQASPTRPNEKIGDGLDVSVRISPKKTDISSLPKIGKKLGKKAHLWAVEVGSETFYARRTALVKCKLIKKSTLSHGKIKKKIEKRCKDAGETKAKAMMQLAERLTFQEQNANLWVMMHFGSLF